MWRFHGRARVNPAAPEAFAVCDRCGFLWNRVNLTYQQEWAGAKLVDRRVLVCDGCLDEPQPQLRTITIPPDPPPVLDPRPEKYAIYDEGDVPTEAAGGAATVIEGGATVPDPTPSVGAALKFNVNTNSQYLAMGL